MCGILGVIDKLDRNVVPTVLCAYIAQKSRGSEGFGFACEKEKIEVEKSTTEWGIMNDLVNTETSCMIFHHRIPTSTENVASSCHPFMYEKDNQKLYLIHNGIISNSDELFKKHSKLGIKYESLDRSGKHNDSESLTIEVGRVLFGEQEKLETHGSAAFIGMIEVDGKFTELIFARNFTSPLEFVLNAWHLWVGSEVSDPKSVTCKVDRLYRYNILTKTLSKQKFVVPGYLITETGGGWEHWKGHEGGSRLPMNTGNMDCENDYPGYHDTKESYAGTQIIVDNQIYYLDDMSRDDLQRMYLQIDNDMQNPKLSESETEEAFENLGELEDYIAATYKENIEDLIVESATEVNIDTTGRDFIEKAVKTVIRGKNNLPEAKLL